MAEARLFAALAALLWGFVPVYIGLIGDVDTTEIVVHRALWSGVILLFLMLLLPKLTGGMAAVGMPCVCRVCGGDFWRLVRC